MPPQLRERRGLADALAVGPLGDHRVECVDGEDDPRLERDVVLREHVGVAAPVDAFVVVADHARLGLHAEAAQQELPCGGVVLDLLVLLGAERSGLSKNGRRDRQLADVVHQRRAGEGDQPRRGQPQLAADGDGRDGDAVAVGLAGGVVRGQPGGQHRDQSYRGEAAVVREGASHGPCDPGVRGRLDTPGFLARRNNP